MRKHRRRGVTGNPNLYIDKASKEIVELWMLKVLIRLNGHRDFIGTMRGFSDDSIAYFLGLDKYVNEYENEQRNEVIQILQGQLESLEASRTPLNQYMKTAV